MRIMPYKDKNKRKEYHKEYYQKNKDILREKRKNIMKKIKIN